jgi:hypothetical protein
MKGIEPSDVCRVISLKEGVVLKDEKTLSIRRLNETLKMTAGQFAAPHPSLSKEFRIFDKLVIDEAISTAAFSLLTYGSHQFEHIQLNVKGREVDAFLETQKHVKSYTTTHFLSDDVIIKMFQQDENPQLIHFYKLSFELLKITKEMGMVSAKEFLKRVTAIFSVRGGGIYLSEETVSTYFDWLTDVDCLFTAIVCSLSAKPSSLRFAKFLYSQSVTQYIQFPPNILGEELLIGLDPIRRSLKRLSFSYEENMRFSIFPVCPVVDMLSLSDCLFAAGINILHLFDKFPNLQILHLRRTSLTRAQIEALRKKNPKLKIKSDQMDFE